MTEPGQSEPESPRSTWRDTALRWTLALGIGFGGAYAVRRVALHLRARALTRVILTDYSRFEGCLIGAPPPAAADVEARATALAQGTGDPLWPHTCSPHLTRLSNEVEDVAGDDASARPLVAATNGMISALGIAVWWAGHVQAGERADPAWLQSYVRLRREMLAFAAARGVALLPPELPRHPRIPRPPDAAPPPPTPVALPGGDEADVVDAAATVGELAIALRDVRSRYSLCEYVPSAHEPQARCAVLDIPIIADPRYAGFVQSDAGLNLAVWSRAPRSLRGLVDVHARRVRLITEGNPDAARDYWVGAQRAMAIQINDNGPAVQIDEGVGTREVALPASLNVIADDRVLLGTPAGPVEFWLEPRNRETIFHAQSMGPAADPPAPARTLATFREPQLTDIDRRLLGCHVPGGDSWVLAGDAHIAFAWSAGGQGQGDAVRRGPSLPRGITRTSKLLCDERGFTLITPGSAGAEALACDGGGCAEPGVVPVEGEASFARAGGLLLVADEAGPERTPRVRRMLGGRVTDEAMWEVPPPAPARTVALVARGADVAAWIVGARSYLFVSTDGGAHFRAVPVAH